jgi:hypothetical protein
MSILVDAPTVKPWRQVLALTHVEDFQIATVVHDRFNAGPSYTHTAPYRKLSESGEMEADTAKRGIGDCRTTERQIQMRQARTAKGKNLGSRVR